VTGKIRISVFGVTGREMANNRDFAEPNGNFPFRSVYECIFKKKSKTCLIQVFIRTFKQIPIHPGFDLIDFNFTNDAIS